MNSYLTRYDELFAPKLTKRTATFRKMFELLDAMPGDLTIVETGCVRKFECWDGDGQSTILFDDYVGHRRGVSSVAAIEINPKAIEIAKSKTDNVTYINADSVAVLHDFAESIDLLYLDSFDFDRENPHPSSLHHLKELAAAQKNLRPGSIICVDDNHPDGTGKGAYVEDYLRNIGIKPLVKDYQIIWIWK